MPVRVGEVDRNTFVRRELQLGRRVAPTLTWADVPDQPTTKININR
ncbi:MAG TPA: hypothetical protein VFH54_10115 [Mycobacteriales bacterium]|nr:hypothetical protein [Mycobacteriales bacterium]